METKTIFNLLKRVFLYHHLIYFSLKKFDDIFNSQKEFLHKLKILSLDLGYKYLSDISLPENDDTIFRIFLIFLITMSFLAIFDFNFVQFICGIASIFIGFVYHNPFFKYNELIAQNIILNLVNAYNLLPSLEFILYVASGFAMIGQSLKEFNLFYYAFYCCFYGDCEENDKKKNKRKCKVNLQVEFDIKGSSSRSSFTDMD